MHDFTYLKSYIDFNKDNDIDFKYNRKHAEKSIHD